MPCADSPLVLALATLAGAAIGGVIAAWIGLKVEEKRQTYAREAAASGERRLAVGAARLLSRDLVRLGPYLRSSKATHCWWPSKADMQIHLGNDEWKLLGSHLPEEAWTDMLFLETWLTTLRLDRSRMPDVPPSPPAAAEFVKQFGHADDLVRKMEAALEEFLRVAAKEAS